MQEKIINFLKLYRTWPVILGSVGLGLLMCVAAFLGLYLVALVPASGGAPTAIILLTPWPTSTPHIPTATPTIIPSPTSDLPPAPLPGEIGVSSYVQIFGTDGAGLNIRQEAGLQSEIRFVALEAEIFEIKQGPTVIEGITWWWLVTPVESARNGWAAANYLS
ncbi:MAG: hypothetical protein N2D54_02570, partial [Chloroflexota bacterium]